MKIVLTKLKGAVLSASDEQTKNQIEKLKNGSQYTCEVKVLQDPDLHNRLLSMIRFGFKYWVSGYSEIQPTTDQFNSYRKELTISAGYYNQVWNRNGSGFTVEAKSLKWSKMTHEERVGFYVAINRTLWRDEFGQCKDQDILNILTKYNYKDSLNV